MVYQTEGLKLNSVQIITDNSVNTVSICKDISANEQTNYTVIELKDHEIARQLIRQFYSNQDGIKSSETLIDCFSNKDNMVLVFPYNKVRPLMDFYIGEKMKLQESERICNNLVLSCITSGLPYPVLYLVLKQRLINMAASGEVFLDYSIDFAEFDNSITEKSCVVECARILLELLKPHANDRKMVSYVLLQKRVASSGYSRFTELYKDITISAADSRKRGLIPRILDWFSANKDQIFRWLLIVSVILGIIVIAALLSNALFGDIPFLRWRSFRIIGTESLVQ